MDFKSRFLLLFCFLISSINYSQNKFTLSGTITDQNTNETLIGVIVSVKEANVVTTTNEYGYYVMTLPEGQYTLEVNSVGYTVHTETISITENTRKNISLGSSDVMIDEIQITASSKATNIRKPEMSINKLTVEEVKKMPVVLGEVDILKSILTLPGVTNAGEGSSGFNVRGGAADQNLILLDEATMYSSSHLFGFFSVFNSDAIKDLKLFKGGIPSRFGGRVSSVLDIYQKEGNSKEFHGTGGVGLISSRLMLEGPIVKDKASFLVAGRSSYAHLFLKLTDNKNSAYFYDLNTKINYKVNDNNSLFLSGYFGRDVFDIENALTNKFGNSLLNLRWNHIFSDKLFSNMSAIYSDYYYGLTLDFIGLNWVSGIQNYNFKYDFKHYLSNEFQLNYGTNLIYYTFNPGEVTPSSGTSSINPYRLDKKYAFEPSLYIDAEQKLTEDISVNYGLRYSLFYRLGGQNLNVYQDNNPLLFNQELQIYESADPIGTKYYERSETIASFNNLEPRVGIAYAFNDDHSVKASYNRMTQYLHLLSNTSAATPLDVWEPSGKFIKPQLLDQYAVGYFTNLKDKEYSIETELFYKTVKNRIDYIDGADLIANDAIERVILSGESRAYGWEVLVRKNKGKLTGFVSYTLSRSEQQTPGRTSMEAGINNGAWYKTPYDKTHDLSITSSYELNPKWSFGAIFSLQSGRPVTHPNGYYEYQGIKIPSFGLRNEDRLPAYHHLDISATYTPKPESKKRWQSEWVFSIYNIYNRQNAASISFRQNEDSGVNEAVRLSIFGVIPSVTYNFKF
jgi:hypothetical protein